MGYSRILLINPRYARSDFGVRHPSAGLGYLAESLRQAGLDYRVLDIGIARSSTTLWEMMEVYQPEIVGISLMTYMFRESYRLLEQIRRRWPDTVIAAGGPHVSCCRKQVMEECPSIDYGFVLEGENSFTSFCLGEQPEEIGGILFRRNGKIVEVPDHPFHADLDAVPFPTYSGFELDKYAIAELVIISSRGCPYQCIFCAAPWSSGSRLRLRSASNVVDELEYWYARDYRKFAFGDDNFTMNRGRVEQICDEILARKLDGLKLRLGNGIRADRVDRRLLERMQEVGFRQVGFGVEGGNDKILANLKKGEKIHHIENAVAAACDLGYDVCLFFLVGSPGETLEDVQDSIRLALKYPVLEARFFNLIPYPKTALYRHVAEHGLFTRNPDDYLNDMDGTQMRSDPVFETQEMPLSERRRALRMCEKVRRITFRRSIARKLRRWIGLRWVIAWIATIPLVENTIRRDAKLRHIANRITLGK